MSKKLYFLISFVLVLSLAGSASAQPETFWTDGGGDHLYCNPANWDNGLPDFNPDLTSWPTSGVGAVIDIAGMTNPILIGPGCDAEAAYFGISGGVNTGPGVALNMTGGTFTTMEIVLGNCDGGFGWMTMSGGTIDLVDYSYLSVGANGGEGRLDMTGGTINVLGMEYMGEGEGHEMWAGCIRLPKNEEGKCEGNDGVGHIQLDGGTINTRMLVMANNGTMDITDGTMIVQDNPAMVAFYLGPNPLTYYINGWIADGNLIAYGGTGEVGVLYVETEDMNEVWLIGHHFGTAWFPQPSDGAIDILRDVVLRWQPGDVQATAGHKLYFGNFADVNGRAGGAYKGALTDPCYSAGTLETLEPAMTYYWVVDEVNGPNMWPGPVWRFTMDRGVAKDPDPPDEAEDVNSRALTLSWAPGMDANDVNGHEVYFGTSYAEVNDANTSTPVVYRGPDDVLGPDGNDRYSYVIPGGDLPFALGETYYWRIDEVNGTNTWKGDVWSFDAEGRAYNVYPADGAVDIPAADLLLRWEAGTDAAGHDVYFGSDEAAVEDANTNTAGIYRGPMQALADVDYLVPEDLEVGKEYFWRIDEVNAVTVKGNVWSFTTGTFLIVDSFEPYRYVDTGDLTAVWKDPLAEPKNDAQIALFFAKTDADKVYGGEQSMEYAYRCEKKSGADFVGSYAAADMPVEVGTDWTAGGIKALVVNFYGDSFNGKDHNSGYVYHISQDQMWVALEDGGANTGIVKLPDMNDVKEESWHTWNISLQDPCFSAVDMNNIARIYIGFGGEKGGQTVLGAGEKSGAFDTVWFDDIRLYPPRCMPEMTGLDVLSSLGDIGGGEEGAPDCNTNYLDLEIMVDDWLVHDYSVLATAPSDVNLVGWWKFEEDFNDSSINGNDGVPQGNTIFVPGYDGNAIELDGDGDYVSIPDSNTPGGVFDIRNAITLTAWIKVPSFDNAWAAIITKGDHCWRMARNGRKDALEFGCTDLSGGDYIAGSIIVSDNLWHHAAGVYDGSKVSLYIDGILDNSMASTGLIRSTSENVWIGSNENYPDCAWNGFIDDVRVYNCALTVGEISVLAGKEGDIYVSLDVPGNIVPKDPCDSEDPNLGTGAFDPNNMDIVNFLDYRIMAEHWLEQHPWP